MTLKDKKENMISGEVGEDVISNRCHRGKNKRKENE